MSAAHQPNAQHRSKREMDTTPLAESPLPSQPPTASGHKKRPFPFFRHAAPLLFAHRGASAEAPENTMAAFERAAEIGVDVLELDVHLSLDGEVFVMHDEGLERTTNGKGLLRNHEAEALQHLDAGAGERIPLLSEVLRQFPSLGVNIDLKHPDPVVVQAVLEVVAQSGHGECLLTSSLPAIMAPLEARAGSSVALGSSPRQVLRFAAGCLLGPMGASLRRVAHRRALQVPPDYDGRFRLVTPRFVRYAHQVQAPVHVWTINAPSEARQLLEMGVDGIMTDDPRKLKPCFT